MSARVRVESQGALIAVVELASERTLVGRGPQCDIQLDDARVSGAHLEITRHGSALIAQDIGSTNGTLLNGRRILQPVRLADGDTLALGGCRLAISIAAPVGTATALAGALEVTLSEEERAVASALVRGFRDPGALAPRVATRAEIAAAAHLAERTVTRRLEGLAVKLKLGPHEARERSHLLAQRILELGLDRQRG